MDNGSQAGETRLVELVVPGIGPVDRAEALEPPVVHRISGDEAAGWYGAMEEDDTEPLVERQVYDWNRLTIGGAGRAMWLLLLPFLLINLVTWMQPRLPRHSRVSGWLYDFGARLLGLSLTVMLVGVFGQAAMDQVVWQCGAPAHSACGAENPLVGAARDVGGVRGCPALPHDLVRDVDDSDPDRTGLLRTWVNIHRETDLLAGPTGVGGVDQEWKDGVAPMDPDTGRSHARTRAQPVFWPLERHNGYRRDPRIAAVRRAILHTLAESAPPPSTPPVTPAPRRPTPSPAPSPSPARRGPAPDPTGPV